MKIVLWGTYDTGKPRIRILRDGLRDAGVDVIEIHRDIWGDINDKSSLYGAGKWLQRGLRVACAYPALIWRYLQAGPHNLVLVSYPGQLDVLVIWLFAHLRRKPVAFDWFISAYDTVVMDRHLVGRHHPIATLLWAGEWLAAHAATLAFMDTSAHARRVEQLFRLAPNHVGRVWVGAETGRFPSTAVRTRGEDLRVLFYGQFIPLHGIDTIIAAARLLHAAPIRWTLIGRGQESARLHTELTARPLPKLRWLDWVDYDQLAGQIAQADVCLGIFGTSDKAASVIPNKVFQIVASGRSLITRDSPAIRELLTEQRPCVTLIPAADAQALADAVRAVAAAPMPEVPCHAAARTQIDPVAIARQFITLVAPFAHGDSR